MVGAGCLAKTPTAQILVEEVKPVIAKEEPIKISEENPITAPIKTGTANIYLIAIDGNGVGGKMVGCGDSSIPVKVTIQNAQTPLSEAIKELLKIKSQFYGQSGLYNSLYQSNLQLSSAVITNGKATIKLTGTTALGGTCDNPRFQAQLEETALQFSSVKSVEIFIDGKKLEDVLSTR